MSYEFLPEFFLTRPDTSELPFNSLISNECKPTKPPNGPPIIDLFDDFPGSLRSTADKLRANPKIEPSPSDPIKVEQCPKLLLNCYRTPWSLQMSYAVNQNMEDTRYELSNSKMYVQKAL